MIDAKFITPTEQVMGFQDANTGKNYYVAVDRLRNKLIGTETITVPLHEELIQPFIIASAIPGERLQPLTIEFNEHIAKGLTEHQSKLTRPMICIFFKDKSWEIIDGKVTYVTAFLSGEKTYKAYRATRQQWAPFIVKNYEERFDAAKLFAKPEQNLEKVI